MSQKNTLDSRAQSASFIQKITNLNLDYVAIGYGVAGKHSIKRMHQVSARYVRAQGHLGGLVEC